MVGSVSKTVIKVLINGRFWNVLCFSVLSKLQTGFRWEVPSPFQLCPESGMLEPGQECRGAVLFRPREALDYQVQACCAFGDEGENRCTVLLQGLCK